MARNQYNVDNTPKYINENLLITRVNLEEKIPLIKEYVTKLLFKNKSFVYPSYLNKEEKVEYLETFLSNFYVLLLKTLKEKELK
jgi:hypothetical protein